MIDFARLRDSLPSLETVIRDCGVNLTRQGSRYFAQCPMPDHDDSSPSFSIYPDGLRCGCKGCGFDGDVFEFIQRFCGLADAAAAAHWLCDRYNVDIAQFDSKPARAKKRETKVGREIEHYDYVDENWQPLFRVRRMELLYADTGEVVLTDDGRPKKTFLQGRLIDGKYHNGMTDARYVLYRLPQVIGADQVWLCEGERDVHAVEAAGAIATTDPGGCGAARHFAERGYPETLRGKDVLLIPDVDKPGRERGAMLAAALHGVAARVRIVSLPEPHKDVRDFLEADGQIEDLLARAVDFTPAPPEPEPEPPPTDEDAPPPPRATVNGNGGDWFRLLLVDRYQNPRPVVANVLTILRHCPEWKDVLWHNEFSQDAVARKPFPGCRAISGEVVWTDRHDTLLLEWLNHHGLSVGVDVVGRAVQAVAEEQRYHPVREFLQDVGSRWDGDPRIDTWLQEYLKVPCGHYHSAVGSRWLISAVARIFQPGAKADCALILEGEQGIKKSTALRILGEPWFTDEIADLGSKEAAIQTRGTWIIEIAELDSMKRVEVGKVKAFMSRGTDRYRPPYGKRPQDYPRQCVFAGSVNHGTYLHDETGNRRFWPVTCAEIDVDRLHADREQIWAEAVVKYRDGHPWWLETHELIAEADLETRERFEADPWEDRIAQYLNTRSETTITAILESCVVKPTKDWTQIDKIRVGRVLRSLRWIRFRGRDEDGNREWRFRPSFGLRQDEIVW